MKIKVVNGTYNSNTFVCMLGDKAVIIDSGASLSDVEKAVGDKRVLAVLITHEHFDHLTNCADYARHYNVPIYGAKEVLDNLKYYRPVLLSEEEEGVVYPIAQLDENVKFIIIPDENPINIEDILIEPFISAGHSPGSIVYKIENDIFTGDLLFARGIGNTIFMTNGKKYMAQSLERLSGLAFNNAYHGHGDSSNYEGQQKNIAVWLKWLTR